jgi:hypothetical protein
MAVLTVTPTSRAGINAAGVAADAALNDEWPNTGQEMVAIKNGGGAGITVTLQVRASLDGAAAVNPTVAIAAGATTIIGPFAPGIYNDGVGRAKVVYSAVTSVVTQVFKPGST